MIEEKMRPNTHNGFVLDYDGPIYPATRANEITYEYFCLMGGLSNGRLTKIEKLNGKFSYHKTD